MAAKFNKPPQEEIRRIMWSNLSLEKTRVSSYKGKEHHLILLRILRKGLTKYR